MFSKLANTMEDLMGRDYGRQRVYNRTEESTYEYKMNPDGKGAVVASTVRGNYFLNKSREGVNEKNQGHYAGMLGGEVDEHGKLVKGGIKKIYKEMEGGREGEEKMEVMGMEDPAEFLGICGLPEPREFVSMKSSSAKVANPTPLPSTDINELLDNFMETQEAMQKDPMVTKRKAIRGD